MKPDLIKRRRWTRLETVAWIAFRDHAAVRVAARIEAGTSEEVRPTNPFSYLAVEGALGIVRYKGQQSDRPGIAVADAIERLEIAERAGRLVADASGRFSVAAITKLFPSKEGRGNGQLKRGQVSRPSVASDGKATYAVETLGWFFLTTRKAARGGNWLDVFDWCAEQGLVTSQKQYEKMRPQAFSFAERELELRLRHNVGVRDSSGSLRPEEYEQCRQNLASWRKPGRPREGK